MNLLLQLYLSTLGWILKPTSSSPLNGDYDFIIVGGGTAGSVIANRLTEDPSWRVLVIESGPSHEGVLNSKVPFYLSKLQKSPYDWNYTSTPQPALGGRTIDLPRGHILGGSSSTNGMMYTRGSSSDFEKYAKETGDPGWSWENVQPYIWKNERWESPADGHNTTGQFNPSNHSFNGINAVSLAAFPQITDSRVLQTTTQLPDEFPFNEDMNSGNLLGVGWLQFTINHGRRSSSATSYLAPKYLGRRNLEVLVNTRVTRILTTKHSSSLPAFHTVEIAQQSTSIKRRITASKEIILSAGAYGTPHILLSSGIGDASELEAVGVEPVLDLPDVGKNLQEHPLVKSIWSVNSSDTSVQYPRDPDIMAQNLQQWQIDHTGPLAIHGATHLIFNRLPNNSIILHEYGDPASGENAPHFETIIATVLSMGPYTGHLVALVNMVVTPTSSGEVTLKSSDPFVEPLINPGLLTSEFDILTMRESVKSSKRFFAAPAWQGFVIGPVDGLANATTDDELDEWIRQTAKAGDHPVGTAAMSAKDAKHGVVDPDLRLKNATGLRVVDASVLPFVPSAHTQVPVYIIAERAADMIKEFWLSRAVHHDHGLDVDNSTQVPVEVNFL